jgi:hypothetical protein
MSKRISAERRAKARRRGALSQRIARAEQDTPEEAAIARGLLARMHDPRDDETAEGLTPDQRRKDWETVAFNIHAGITEVKNAFGTVVGYRYRDERGRYARSQFYPWEVEDAAVDTGFEAFMGELFADPNPRGIANLGTYRSKRKAADLRREAVRATSCEWCGREMPKNSRSDARTCSERCKKARQRSGPKTGRASLPRPGYAVNIGRIMEPKRQLSPLTRALIAAIEEVLTVPMPYGYPDEREWREGQYHVLKRLRREERSLGRDSVAMFKRRARSYINAQRRLAAANPAPEEANSHE